MEKMEQRISRAMGSCYSKCVRYQLDIWENLCYIRGTDKFPHNIKFF